MPYFTIDELRELPQMENTTKYSDERITSARDWIEAIIERKCGTSFVPRVFTEVVDGDRANRVGGLLLSTPHVLSVTAVESNGVALNVGQLAEINIRSGILIRRTTGNFIWPGIWDVGIRNIEVTGTSGYASTPPADIKEAALTAARDWLLRRYGSQGVSNRAVSVQTEMGNTVFATANDLYRPTGIPDVDATIMGWANRLDLYGFA